MSIVHDQRRTTGSLLEPLVKKLLELGNLLAGAAGAEFGRGKAIAEYLKQQVEA